jgi:nicotinamide-nucleotide amidase
VAYQAAATARIIARLTDRGESLAVAESLTGGLLAATIVDVAGASAVFRGGLVVYATDLKAKLTGVDPQLLADRGPVDPEVARQLADGVRERFEAVWGLATTGVAGPTPQDGKPVGLVFVGVAGPGISEAKELLLTGGRAEIRRAAASEALALLDSRVS